MTSRRDFLKRAAVFSGAMGAAAVLPESVERAFAIEADAGSTFLDAEHVVILMQENRSFDHCFGALQGVRGFNDPRAITQPDGNRVWLQTNAQGHTFAPFRLNMKESNATWLGSLPHTWQSQVDARNNGACDKWLTAKDLGRKDCPGMPFTLGYYTRQDIPFYYALADAFTVCDQNFCSSLTGTSPNRLFLWTGTIRGSHDASAPAKVNNQDIDYIDSSRWTTFPERLEQAGVSWKIYQNELSGVPVGFSEEQGKWLANFTDNQLEWFSQYRVKFSAGYRAYQEAAIAQLPAAIEAQKAAIQSLAENDPKRAAARQMLAKYERYLRSFKQDRITWSPQNFAKLPERERNLHNRAFCTNIGDPAYHELETMSYLDGGAVRTLNIPKGDILHQFRQDVDAGNLPAVSWLVAPEQFSDHPESPWYGAWYVSEVLDILTRDPAVWKKTILILTYDENDGYFDHAPPFVAPHPHKPESGAVSQGIDAAVEYVTYEQDLRHQGKGARESSIGLGYRVPMVIASPWSRGGYVCSQVFDHTSILQFLEVFATAKSGKKIEETNLSAWRRAVCGDLTASFRRYRGEKIALPKPVEKEPFIEDIHRAQFKAYPAGFKALDRSEIAKINRFAPNSGPPSPCMPQQEPGMRPSCTLPYQLYADARLNRKNNSLDIAFAAKTDVFRHRSAGSPFNVYSLGKSPAKFKSRAFAVAAGSSLDYALPLDEFGHDARNGVYHVRVYGPNGFNREYRGNRDDPLLEIQCEYAAKENVLTGQVELAMTNVATASYSIEISDNAYQNAGRNVALAAGGRTRIVLGGADTFGWYDWSVRVAGFANYAWRYAGRVETGKPGFTDPFMGRAVRPE